MVHDTGAVGNATSRATAPSELRLRGRRAQLVRQPGPGARLWAALGTVEAGAAVAGLAVFGWAVGTPSPWQDEAATLAVSRRSLGQLIEVLGSVDLVHGVYYLLAHAAQGVDASITSARFISVVAFAGVAVVMVRIGRVLGSPTIAATAAALVVVSPLASRYAQDARPFAVATLAATWSTYALLLAGQARGRVARSAQVRGWAVYAGSVVVLGLVEVLALLMLVVHAGVVLLLTMPRSPQDRRGARRDWGRAAGAAVALLSPFIAVAWSQRDQVDWIQTPHLYDLTGFYIVLYQSRVAVVLMAVAAAAAATIIVRRMSRGEPPPVAFVLGALWAGLPPLLLWTISLVKPLWDLHYVLFCLPGAALLIASLPAVLTPLVARRRPRTARYAAAAGVVLLLAAVGLPQQRAYRDADTGHVEDLRSVAAYLRANALPGDSVLYSGGQLRTLTAVYPASFGSLDDVALAQDPLVSATVAGVEVSAQALPAALGRSTRVWLIRHPPDAADAAQGTVEGAKLAALTSGFRPISTVAISTLQVSLYLPR